MASGQVIGRHEVYEYNYRLGPSEERRRIKLVVIQRRDQRRKSLIAAQNHLERAPVKLRVNLHRAQYGVSFQFSLFGYSFFLAAALTSPLFVVAQDPEVTSGSRHVPITIRRKPKPARIAAAHPVRVAVPAASTSTPEPTRIELVDPPVRQIEHHEHHEHHEPRDDSVFVTDPPPVLVFPDDHELGNKSLPTPPLELDSPPRPSSAGSNRPTVKRSGSLASSFRRFPSLMGMIRRNSKSTAPPTIVTQDSPPPHTEYFHPDAPRSPGSHYAITEEREVSILTGEYEKPH